MLLNLERVDFLVAQYVAGSLPPPAHVLVGSHLQMQAPAGRFAHTLQRLAGESLEAVEPQPLKFRDRTLFDILKSMPPRLDGGPVDRGMWPALLRAYAGKDLSGIPWRTKLPGLREHVIERSSEVEASLLWARPGRALPNHGHHGLELTLVLEGEFHDHRGIFAEGDVSVADETLDHRPIAGDKPCVCFSVLFAPIALSGPMIRLFGDIIGV